MGQKLDYFILKHFVVFKSTVFVLQIKYNTLKSSSHVLLGALSYLCTKPDCFPPFPVISYAKLTSCRQKFHFYPPDFKIDFPLAKLKVIYFWKHKKSWGFFWVLKVFRVFVFQILCLLWPLSCSYNVPWGVRFFFSKDDCSRPVRDLSREF